MIDRHLMGRWADATRRQQWDEADRLWRQLMADWLKPPVVDQAYWNCLLSRKMSALERREERRMIDDDEWDNSHQDMGQMNIPAKVPEGDVMESVIAKGDLAKLTPDERVRYYTAVCKSLGINPLTQPLSYITLNGKLTLYATRTCTDQLRKINGVSLEIVSRHVDDDILTVHVKAHTPDGRMDEDFGSVAFPSLLKGEARANAVLKAVTKAKRRATLSICGLGWLDETEVADIPDAKLPPHNPQTGEITESAGVSQAPPDAADAAPADASPHEAGAAVSDVEDMAREAAMRGEDVFNDFYKRRAKEEKELINAIGPELRRSMKYTEAYKRGQAARSAGHKRQALPGEYREDDRAREGLCWTAGFDGQAMPEFGE